MRRGPADANHSHCGDQRNVARPSGGWLGDRGPKAGQPTAAPVTQPKARRRGETVLGKLTTNLADTYSMCGLPHHEQPKTTRRILTKNSQVVSNNGWDNSDNNIVLRVRDLLEVQSNSGAAKTFVVLDLLGQGTFGQVFRCQDVATKAVVAIKIIRNHPSYYKQALVEVQVSQLLTSAVGMEGHEHVVDLLDYFMFQNHLCLVFELLSLNLYELLNQNSFRGLPLSIVRGFLHQILRSLVLLNNSCVIHCDLKPENILLSGQDKLYAVPSLANQGEAKQVVPSIKLVDFGSACYENETVFSYIQSRFYRSPEVLLGLPYCGAIDMWSLGCVSAEMYLGLPLFPGASDHDQLKVIIDTFGYPPLHMVQNGTNLCKFFNITKRHGIILKTPDEFARDTNSSAVSSKRYFKHSALDDIINAYPFRKGASDDEVSKERNARAAFCDLLRGLLALDPQDRWTAHEALHHPFITGLAFTQPYKPTAPARHMRFRRPMVPMDHPFAPPYSTPLSISAPLAPPPYFAYHHPHFPLYSHSCPFPTQRELFPPMAHPSRPFHGHNDGYQHDDYYRDFSHAPDHWDPFFMQGLEESLLAPPKVLAKPSGAMCCRKADCSCGKAPLDDSHSFHRKWRRRRKREKQPTVKQ